MSECVSGSRFGGRFFFQKRGPTNTSDHRIPQIPRSSVHKAAGVARAMEEHIAVFEDLPIAAVALHLDPMSIVKLAATCRIAASLSADWQARAAKGIHRDSRTRTRTIGCSRARVAQPTLSSSSSSHSSSAAHPQAAHTRRMIAQTANEPPTNANERQSPTKVAANRPRRSGGSSLRS